MKSFEIIVGITTKCNANCILCKRQTQPYKTNELDLNKITPHLKHCNKISFIGGYGEAVLHKNFLEYVKFINDEYPDIEVTTSSNMGSHNNEYWGKLGELNITLFACIDGIDDLNIYRNVDYQKALSNLISFNKSGGKSYWSSLWFSFNEHLMPEMKIIAKDINCNGFKVMRSDLYNSTFFSSVPDRQKLKKIFKSKEINCTWKHNKVYIDENGLFCPCCKIESNNKDVFSDPFISEFYKNNNMGIENDFTKNIESLEKIYNNVNKIEHCISECKIRNEFSQLMYFIEEIDYR